MRDLLAQGHIRLRQASLLQSQGENANPVAGKSFCFTGELVTLKRQEAEKRVRDLGGSSKTSVTKDLDYLVTNEPESGSAKNIKARTLGIAIIDEKGFLALLGQANPS
jgi:DNA ligase (NAD+)